MEDAEIVEEVTKPRRKETFLRSSRFKLYCSYALSAWSDRAWSFAVSIALYEVGGNLLLPALSNLLNSLTVIVFGVVIGKWIDKSNRLKAGRWSLMLNNTAVAGSGLCLVLTLWDGGDVKAASHYLYWALVATAMALCAASCLAGAATKIVVAKDWVTVVAGGDKETLAELNAKMVLIDHVCGILSPLVAGQIMTSVDIAAGCLFVAVWNILSFPVEYGLLSLVYSAIPALANPRSNTDLTPTSKEEPLPSSEAQLLPPTADKLPLETMEEETMVRKGAWRGAKSARNYLRGWGNYFSHRVFPAAFALALVYFTVLGLDGITSSYIISQGLAPNLLGASRALGALTGIGGSLAFPKCRSGIGLGWTGIFGLGSQVAMLTLPLASLWLPGSPFHWTTQSPPPGANSSLVLDSISSGLSGNASTTAAPVAQYKPTISIIIFVTGIVLSRFGLWMSDLTITQVMQEEIVEKERGAIFGVQSSAQQIFSLLKDVLVILIPETQYFGYLIVVSFVAIVAGFTSYAVFFAMERRRPLT